MFYLIIMRKLYFHLMEKGFETINRFEKEIYPKLVNELNSDFHFQDVAETKESLSSQAYPENLREIVSKAMAKYKNLSHNLYSDDRIIFLAFDDEAAKTIERKEMAVLDELFTYVSLTEEAEKEFKEKILPNLPPEFLNTLLEINRKISKYEPMDKEIMKKETDKLPLFIPIPGPHSYSIENHWYFPFGIFIVRRDLEKYSYHGFYFSIKSFITRTCLSRPCLNPCISNLPESIYYEWIELCKDCKSTIDKYPSVRISNSLTKRIMKDFLKGSEEFLNELKSHSS